MLIQNLPGWQNRDMDLASAAQRGAARDLYCDEPDDLEIGIDDDALLSPCDDGSYWVQAWLRVPPPDDEGED